MEFLGSQFGMILFIAVGVIIISLISKAMDAKIDSEKSDDILGCLFTLGAIFALFCFLASQCS
jgi:glucose uptake protein GlcU